MEKIIFKTEKDGYAILFTVIVVSIISMIAMGLASNASKQITLSSVARDSTTAFYQADMASECAFYADYNYRVTNLPGSPWTCGGQDLYLTSTGTNPITYNLDPSSALSSSDSNKCFRIVITKTTTPGVRIDTQIEAKGYNICNKSNAKTVERALEANY